MSASSVRWLYMLRDARSAQIGRMPQYVVVDTGHHKALCPVSAFVKKNHEATRTTPEVQRLQQSSIAVFSDVMPVYV